MTILSLVKKGSKAKVHSFNENLLSKSMMIGLGILPGDTIDLVSESFLGSPLTIRLTDGETVAMRIAEAALINVEIIG
ncbi:FeoA family protein [Bacteriovorax sp. Seq25_V]|uniref:FeoA family protein n=1 Tax=Bacteriovorax sp. Seq25_V TaxID=1201288 RepID=UPI000389F6CF|nr:FeoA family protein [Bacteriovorax sp. Seq25_V]EQC47339.1 FeoA domain protein [Bacteriovorax sp. Seq25_V]